MPRGKGMRQQALYKWGDLQVRGGGEGIIAWGTLERINRAQEGRQSRPWHLALAAPHKDLHFSSCLLNGLKTIHQAKLNLSSLRINECICCVSLWHCL
jgi:hypothetical protein